MPVSGLVIRLSETSPEVQSDIAKDARITLGELQAGYLPAVLETRTLQESEAVVEALFSRAGVLGVDIVTVDFADSICTVAEAS